MNAMPDSLERLYGRHVFGIKLGLDRIQSLLDRMGNPERALAVIHVGGTNGKGSVCALMDSVLRSAGYRTGLYTSPHLVSLNERFRVGGECISDAELLELIDFVGEHDKALSPVHGEATFFEFTTAMAFEYFRRREARVVVVEVGMGGRLDATNVVTPLLSIITSISVEHAQHLGPDVASIAREKAGIIKQGRPVVCGDLPQPALQVVKEIADKRQARLVLAKEAVSVRRMLQNETGQKIALSSSNTDYSTITMPLLGWHQLANCSTAVAAVEEIEASCGLPVGVDAVRKGIGAVRWPGRCEMLSTTPTTILDGAHNPGAAEQFAATVRDIARKRPVALVFGMCNDKDISGFLRQFTGIVRSCWAVTLQNDRGVARTQLALAAGKFGWNVHDTDLPTALAEAEKWATACNGVVCITGSLYLVGEVMELRRLNPFVKHGEPNPGGK